MYEQLVKVWTVDFSDSPVQILPSASALLQGLSGWAKSWSHLVNDFAVNQEVNTIKGVIKIGCALRCITCHGEPADLLLAFPRSAALLQSPSQRCKLQRWIQGL